MAALLAFALIFLQADYELSFDKCHPTADRVFRADKKGDESLFRNILPRGFADDIIGLSAHIEAGCTIMQFLGEFYYSVVEGDSHALEGPNSVIIPRSLSENLFPSERAIGKLLKKDAKYMEIPREITVTGVYEDFPTNTQLVNDLYLTVGDVQKRSYGGANFVCYLLLDDAGNAQAVADEFNAHFDFPPQGDWLTPIELVPLTSIYFRNEGNVYKSGSRSQYTSVKALLCC